MSLAVDCCTTIATSETTEGAGSSLLGAEVSVGAGEGGESTALASGLVAEHGWDSSTAIICGRGGAGEERASDAVRHTRERAHRDGRGSFLSCKVTSFWLPWSLRRRHMTHANPKAAPSTTVEAAAPTTIHHHANPDGATTSQRSPLYREG